MPEQAATVPFTFHGLGRADEQVEISQGTTFEDVLRAREIHPETVLVFCDDEVVPAETEIPPGSEIRVLRITSGGSS